MATDVQRSMNRVDKILGEVEPLIKRFADMSDDLVQTLNKADKANDRKFVLKVMESIDVRRPLLIGETVLKKITSARNELYDLRDRLDIDDDAEVRNAVRPDVETAIQIIERALREHIVQIKAITKLQDETKSFVRRVLTLVGGLVKDVVSLFTGGPTSFLAKATQVMAGVQGTSRTLVQFVKEARVAVHRAERELDRIRKKIERAV